MDGERDEFNNFAVREERTRRLTTSERERDKIAGTKLAERKVQFEAVEDRKCWVKFGIHERAQVYSTRGQKPPSRPRSVDCGGVKKRLPTLK